LKKLIAVWIRLIPWMAIAALGFCLPLSGYAQKNSDAANVVGPAVACHSDFSTGGAKICASTPSPTVVATPSRSTQTITVTVAIPKLESQPVTTKSNVIGGVSDQEVDDFLQRWGKPSSEAVRASLNPTDENIQAMRKKNLSDLSLAAYIANRSGQLNPAGASAIAVEPLGAGEAPALNRMKVILYTNLKCAVCDSQLTALQTLLAQAPMLDASVAVTSAMSEKELIVELARLGLTLPLRLALPSEIARLGKSAPFIHVIDIKNQTEGTLPSSAATEDIKVSIMNFRKKNDTQAEKKGSKK
jgi:hypothetical protein